MAPRLKPAGGKPPKPKKVKTIKGGKRGSGPKLAVDNSRAPGKGGGKNICSRAEAIAHIEDIFELHRELNEVSAAVRKKIADAYGTAAKKIGISKKATKHLFKLEKFRRENEAAEAEFDGRDRDGFLLAAEIFGADTPFGQFAAEAAGRAKTDGFGGSDAGEESEGEE
jgi:hypothetical protein